MTYTVFFKEGNKTFSAANFISDQPTAHQSLLKSISDELASQGTITHPQATKNANAEWSVLLQEDSDVYCDTLYVSKFELQEADRQAKVDTTRKRKILVIIDPSGARDSIGGYHPGYWPVERYVNFLEENQKSLFIQTVHQIRQKIPSGNYSVNNDGSVSIHVKEISETTTISLACRAEWILLDQ